MQRSEAAFHAARSQDLPSRDRLRPALERDRTEIAVVEVSPGQPAGVRANHDRAGHGERLQARREVRRLADDRLLLRRAVADHVADNDSPRGDADPKLQRNVDLSMEMRHGLDQHEPGAHRLLGVILMRVGIAEIGKDAVSHMSGDVSLVTVDHLGDAGVIRSNHLPHVLRVQLRREGRRADQIAKHHRKLASLGVVPRRGLG